MGAESLSLLTRCRMCILQHRHVPVRWGSSWKQRVQKREDVRERVVQYAGDKAEPSERLYTWGRSTTGALGIRSYVRPEAKGQRVLKNQYRPALMAYWEEHKIKVEDVACGYGFTVFSTRKNKKSRIYGTGVNTDSQLGVQEYPRNTGRLLDYVIEPVPIDLPLVKPDTTRVQHLSCGRSHTVILTDEGVFSLGNNAYGQCGRPVIETEQYRGNPLIHKIKELPENISQVVCGQDHTLFLTEDGDLYSCGMGADGQTGAGHFDCVGVPTRVIGDIQGEVITQVASSGDCVLAVSDKGDVFGWGNSEYNQLSMVSMETQVPVARHLPMKGCGRVVMAAAGGSICGVISEDGRVFVWGYGILGKGPNLDTSERPTQIPDTLFGKHEFDSNIQVTTLRAGLAYFAAITTSGDLYTWGNNRGGNLGFGHPKDQFFPLKVSVPAQVKEIRCGVDHAVAMCKTFT